MKKILSNLLIIVCFCSFCFFAYKIYNYFEEEKKQKKLNNGIIDTAITKVEQTNNTNNDKEILPIEVDFNKLKNENEQIIAWIYSKDTPINYPVVQGKDNDYYLRRLIDGSYNIAGTIFLDFKNSSNFDDYNSIIYGHNMKNDSMFGTLTNYESQEYFNEHKEMFLFTENKNYKIELFAGFTTTSESDVYKYPKSSKTNEKLIEEAIKKSSFKSNVNVSNEDKILMLSTCSYDYENARYVLLGRLKEV